MYFISISWFLEEANATIVLDEPANRWPDSIVINLPLTNYYLDTVPTEEVKRLDIFGPGYWFGVIIVGEIEHQKWQDRDFYNWLEEAYYSDEYYEVLDIAVCCWLLPGKLSRQTYRPLNVLPSGYGLTVFMIESEYYKWIDLGYYGALDQGVWYYLDRIPYVIPEPATIGLLGLGLIFLLSQRKKHFN